MERKRREVADIEDGNQLRDIVRRQTRETGAVLDSSNKHRPEIDQDSQFVSGVGILRVLIQEASSNKCELNHRVLILAGFRTKE